MGFAVVGDERMRIPGDAAENRASRDGEGWNARLGWHRTHDDSAFRRA
jgi:hypothetical protein